LDRLLVVFAKSDADQSGEVDIAEFVKAIEFLDIQVADVDVDAICKLFTYLKLENNCPP
jgi:hypothetical protein